jgi:hypothetical protein
MEANPLNAVVAVKPALWCEHGYDAVTQVFAWALADSQRRSLPLEIDFDDFAEPGIRFLERVPPDSLHGALVIGRVQRRPRGLSLLPYSLHLQNGDVVHLGLDNLNTGSSRPVVATDEVGEGFEAEEEAEPTTAFSNALSHVLDEMDDGLLALAEAGLAGLNPLRLERVRHFLPRTERVGLRGLTVALSNFVAQPDSFAVLRCAYLSQLHRRGMPLTS